ncbi:MAG: DUF4115 domain-containing protein [Actinomycetota bacterium]|nr:MAG: DUF4115 domain-containing protein [Actinomycetota bacterium]
MALLILALFALIILSFLGAVFSSRVRSEKKSIANFHEQMGQLSGVVRSESHAEDANSQTKTELFAPTPSHVKVVGKANVAKSPGTGRRRNFRAGTSTASGGTRSRSSATRGTSPSSARQPGSGTIPTSESKPVLREVNAGNDGAAQPVSAGNEGPAVSRRTRLSSSTRPAGPKVHTEVLHFDDDPADNSDRKISPGPIFGSRKLNARVLAVASAVALVGFGVIVAALNAAHSSNAPSRSSVVTVVQNPGASKSATATTEAPSTPAGPLTPTSADSTGATYFINASSITLTISASAPAWLEESVSPGSKILWQGIIPSGGSKTLTLNSSMWIRTGNVGVLTITANGRPVSFSATPGVYEFTFRQGVKA